MAEEYNGAPMLDLQQIQWHFQWIQYCHQISQMMLDMTTQNTHDCKIIHPQILHDLHYSIEALSGAVHSRVELSLKVKTQYVVVY